MPFLVYRALMTAKCLQPSSKMDWLALDMQILPELFIFGLIQIMPEPNYIKTPQNKQVSRVGGLTSPA